MVSASRRENQPVGTTNHNGGGTNREGDEPESEALEEA
jgi:hypothetical protein